MQCFNVKGDYYRYLAEFTTGDAESKAAQNARVACAGDTKMFLQNLVVACKTANVAFEDTIAEPDQQSLDFGARSVIAKEMFSAVKLAREIDEPASDVVGDGYVSQTMFSATSCGEQATW